VSSYARRYDASTLRLRITAWILFWCNNHALFPFVNVSSQNVFRVNVQCFRVFYVMQSRTTTVIHYFLKTSLFTSYYSMSSFLPSLFLPSCHSFFLHSIPYSILSFMNVTLLHYNVFTKAVHNQTSKWLLVGYCTTYIAVALYFHTKRLKEEQHKRLRGCVT
jgi:hypothetical protein